MLPHSQIVSAAQKQPENKQFVAILKDSIKCCFQQNGLFQDSNHLQLQSLAENQLIKGLLIKNFLSPLNRVKLRDWIHQMCADSYFGKRTAPLACQYVDLCFSNGMVVNSKGLKEFGTACLWIAIKLNECMDRQYDLGQANHQKIIQFENQILLRLNFKINPMTYLEIGTQILRHWNNFQSASMKFYQSQKAHESNFMMLYVFSKCVHLKFSHHLLFELMQYAFHFIQTLDKDLDQFCFNCFYFILCTQVFNITGEVNDGHLESYYSNKTELAEIIEIFIEFCRQHSFGLSLLHNPKMLKYVCLIYNSLIEGFDYKHFNRPDITKYDPDHWMWSEKKLYSTQTHFFNCKEKSFNKVKGSLAQLVAIQKKEDQLAVTGLALSEQKN